MTTRFARALVVTMLSLMVTACADPGEMGPPPTGPRPAPTDPVPQPGKSQRNATPAQAAGNFTSVLRTMEPAIERECRARRTAPINCDYQFVVDDRSGLEPNAFQTIDRQGRPIIGFTLSLLAAADNTDELAFVVGHEASHHILNHLQQRENAAAAGAIIVTGLAAAAGAAIPSVEIAQRIGAQMGAQYYSKEWELQADYLGAIIAMKGGYNPVRGALFFARMPDPGDQILGSHPSRAARQMQVAKAVEDIRSGRAN